MLRQRPPLEPVEAAEERGVADEEDRRKTEGLSEIEVTTSTAPWKSLGSGKL